MPRRPNARPTNIYWLYDVRPDTIADGWPNGKPFYCGKTVATPQTRLSQHRCQATRKPHGDVGARVVECDQFIRIQIMEVVPFDQDWCAREKFWVATGRFLYPGMFLNVSDGGEGAPGYIPTAATRAKLSAARVGKKRSAETCAKMSAARKGIKLSSEWRENLRLAHLGKKLSAEHVAKRSAGQRASGIKLSPAHLAALSASRQGKKASPETRARMREGQRRRWTAPESRAEASASQKRRWAADALTSEPAN